MDILGGLGTLFNTVANGFRTPTSYGPNGYYGSAQYKKDMSNAANMNAPAKNALPYSGPAAAPVDYGSTTAALDKQIAQLTATLNAQPKLPAYDILGNYNKAKAQATANVTPLYDQKLQNFLDTQATETGNQQATADLSKQNSAITNTNTLADNATQRVRTGQDLQTALAAIAQNRNNFLQDDGNQFDTARRALGDQIAATGGTDTGLGQDALATQLRDRDINANRQLVTLGQQEAGKNLAATRSLQDLATSDTRANQQQTQSNAATDLNLHNYLDTLTGKTTDFTLQNNLSKAADIATQTGSISKQLAAQFVASLAANGAPGGDVALAQRVYGG